MSHADLLSPVRRGARRSLTAELPRRPWSEVPRPHLRSPPRGAPAGIRRPSAASRETRSAGGERRPQRPPAPHGDQDRHPDGLAVRGVPLDRRLEPHEGDGGDADVRRPGVREGDAEADGGRGGRLAPPDRFLDPVRIGDPAGDVKKVDQLPDRLVAGPAPRTEPDRLGGDERPVPLRLGEGPRGAPPPRRRPPSTSAASRRARHSAVVAPSERRLHRRDARRRETDLVETRGRRGAAPRADPAPSRRRGRPTGRPRAPRRRSSSRRREKRRVEGAVEARDPLVVPVGREEVLGEVVRADAEEVGLLRERPER